MLPILKYKIAVCDHIYTDICYNVEVNVKGQDPDHLVEDHIRTDQVQSTRHADHDLDQKDHDREGIAGNVCLTSFC